MATTRRTSWPTPWPSASGPRPSKGSFMTRGFGVWRRFRTDVQLRILTAPQASDPPRTQDRARRSPGAAGGNGRGSARPRGCHLPTLEPGELRFVGPPLHCPTWLGRLQMHHLWQNREPQEGQVRTQVLAVRRPLWPRGAPRPCRPRLKWNRANKARRRRQGEGGHQAVKYNSAQHDGRWLCMRCGLHYVRFCDLRAKRCAGAPAGQAATQAIADALAGGPLTRRKVHAFAKHPSGSRPGAPAARLPSDRLVLDPSVPRPPGPAAPKAQEQVADARPEAPMAHVAASRLSPAQDEARGEPRAVAEGPAPATEKRQRSGEANREEGRGEGSQGIRAFLGLGPSGVEPGSRARPAVDVGRSGKPVKPKTKPAQGGPTGRKPRKPRTLPEPGGPQGPHPPLAGTRDHRWVDGPRWHPWGIEGAPSSDPRCGPARVRRRDRDGVGPEAPPGGPRQLNRPPSWSL